MNAHPATVALLEAFLSGDIGMRLLCQRLDGLDISTDLITQAIDVFHGEGRLSPRTAGLIRDHVRTARAARAPERSATAMPPVLAGRRIAPAAAMPKEVLHVLPDPPAPVPATPADTPADSSAELVPLQQLSADVEGLLSRITPSGRSAAGVRLPYPQQMLPAAPEIPDATFARKVGRVDRAVSVNAAAPDHVQIEDMITAALFNDMRGVREDAQSGARNVMARQLAPWLTPFRDMQKRRKSDREAGEASPQAVPELGPGHMLKNRFVLESQIGEGGMGRVFRAVDRRRVEVGDAQPYVALKVLAARFREHPDALRSLEAEARKVQLLSHPNICPIFDFDRDGPHAFFVMELLHGETLEAALERAGGKPLHRDLRMQVLVGLFAAMSHVHRRKVVHGDLKPGNLFLCRGGVTKVLDFGVATTLRGKGFDPAALKAFTPAFSSPEMIEGAPRDPRDDVFSIGCLIYLAWTGRHPYRRMPANQARDTGLMPPPVEQMPAPAAAALMSALAFDRAARPPDAGALGLAMLPSIAGRHQPG